MIVGRNVKKYLLPTHSELGWITDAQGVYHISGKYCGGTEGLSQCYQGIWRYK